MKFILKLSRVPDSERRIECISVRFNEEDYQLHLHALVEDIYNIPGINSAEHRIIDDLDCIVVDSESGEDFLLEAMKPLFQRELCYVRYVEFIKAE